MKKWFPNKYVLCKLELSHGPHRMQKMGMIGRFSSELPVIPKFVTRTNNILHYANRKTNEAWSSDSVQHVKVATCAPYGVRRMNAIGLFILKIVGAIGILSLRE